MRYRLCDTEEEVSGIAVELAIQAEPFADDGALPAWRCTPAALRGGAGASGAR